MHVALSRIRILMKHTVCLCHFLATQWKKWEIASQLKQIVWLLFFQYISATSSLESKMLIICFADILPLHDNRCLGCQSTIHGVCACVFCVLLSFSATRLFFTQHETALWSRHLSRNKNTGVFSGFTPEGQTCALDDGFCVWPLDQPKILTTTLHPYCCKHSIKTPVTLRPGRRGTRKTASIRAEMEQGVKHCTAIVQERSCSLYRCWAHNSVSGAACKV